MSRYLAGRMSVFARGGYEAVVASHLLQHLGQATQVAVGKVLGLPQVQDHPRGTGFGGEVVQVPARGRERATRQRGMVLGRGEKVDREWIGQSAALTRMFSFLHLNSEH